MNYQINTLCLIRRLNNMALNKIKRTFLPSKTLNELKTAEHFNYSKQAAILEQNEILERVTSCNTKAINNQVYTLG